MIYTHLHWTVFHMGLENTSFVVSLLLAHAKMWLRRLIRTCLHAHR